ncbi:hypothetical protein FVEN_g12622 [Fusarium venenatum]|nr:hypothetical protein FVEN_g12622 [Fusarium venenatum]
MTTGPTGEAAMPAISRDEHNGIIRTPTQYRQETNGDSGEMPENRH